MLRLSWSHKTGNDVVAAGKNPCMRQVESSMDVKWECKLLIDLCDMHLSNACMDAESTDDDGEMVELNGMLVSAAAAQRRQFFSSLIQRASKMKHSLGGGSLTLLLALPGVPAKGERTVGGVAAMMSAGKPTMDKYKHLSPELKAKLAAALDAKAVQLRDAGAAPMRCVA
jgi:hypothetical protein